MAKGVCPICDVKQPTPGRWVVRVVGIGGNESAVTVRDGCSGLLDSIGEQVKDVVVRMWREAVRAKAAGEEPVPPCPPERTEAFQDGWAAFHLCKDVNPWPGGSEGSQSWYVGWDEAKRVNKAAKADVPAEEPTCPKGKSPEYREGWAAYCLDLKVNPYDCDTVLSRNANIHWFTGWQGARRDAPDLHKATADAKAEQPAPALPRVIWRGKHPVEEYPIRIVEVAEGSFGAERSVSDCLGESAWNPQDMSAALCNTLAFEYLRKLAGEPYESAWYETIRLECKCGCSRSVKEDADISGQHPCTTCGGRMRLAGDANVGAGDGS